jgi:hypothetical protein
MGVLAIWQPRSEDLVVELEVREGPSVWIDRGTS